MNQPLDPAELARMSRRVVELRQEHRDLDTAIERLAADIQADELALKRLKKRKLQLKDQIALIEDYLIPAIGEQLQQAAFDVLFLSGIGEVFPYIRSHNVLNNLQSTAKGNPTVLFFPGEYRHSLEQGASLELFGLLHDDKYYRAFNIFETQV